MSATPPLTPEQIINIVNKAMERKGDLHARITVARKVTVPGQTEYSSEGVTFGVEIDVPHGENLIDATRRAKADLEVLVGEFKAAHLIKQSSEKGTQFPKTEPQEFPWRTTKNPDIEMLPADTPGAKQFADLAVQGQQGYWMNKEGTLIFRRKPK